MARHQSRTSHDRECSESDEEVVIDSDGREEAVEPELADVEAASEDKLKALRNKLRTCEEEKRTIREEAQRERAEFLNARRRLEESAAQKREQALEEILVQLFSLHDSFAQALDDPSWEQADPQWQKGITGILTQLERIFSTYGVVTVRPTGEPFDPTEHEAVSNVSVTDPAAHDTVVAVLQAGFRRTRNEGSSVLLRPARVSVGTAHGGSDADTEN